MAAGSSDRRRALLMVTTCTIIGAFAQLLIKSGANSLPSHLGFDLASALTIATSVQSNPWSLFTDNIAAIYYF